MILRTILFAGALTFFLWDYSVDSKAFKRAVFPVIGISYFASTDLYSGLDNRIKLILVVILVIFTLRYAISYYNDYKKERFREKKRIREIRNRERIEQGEQLLEEILEAKNQGLREKSSSYEIIMDFSEKSLGSQGQISFLGIVENPYIIEFEEEEIIEETGSPVLENQLDMFDI